jgi:Radical SAM superfamily/B12 binding domain/Protein of unknown function (DUF4080)
VPEILLVGLNARYAHCAFGLRCLAANMGELSPRTAIREWEASARTVDLLEAILAEAPRVVGFGVYVWNTAAVLALVADLKALRPQIIVVVGGPELSHELDHQPLAELADHVITGEADLAFADLCRRLLAGEAPPRRIAASPPDLATLVAPYGLYSAEDIAQRVVYAEASRGCPFRCEFCLSSLDERVRPFPLEAWLAEIDALWARGLRQIKLVDRTFNLHIDTARRILEHLLGLAQQGLFVHLEMVPDRLPEALREPLRRFPPGSLQVEVGVQTLDPAVSARISRRLDLPRLEDNLRFLREQTTVHIHADLIVGLPGEGLVGFGRGFDHLWSLRPHEIQVGLLKRLKGTPISRHDRSQGQRWSSSPPFELLESEALPFADMHRLRRFSRYWDLIANNGHFQLTLPLLLGDSPFDRFLRLSDWLWSRTGQTHALALPRLGALLYGWLGEVEPAGRGEAAEALYQDWLRPGRVDLPGWLSALFPDRPPPRRERIGSSPARRQDRHR